MASKDMKAGIIITADGNQAIRALNSVTARVKNVGKSLLSLKSLLIGALTTYGVTKLAKSFIEVGREVEQLEIKIDRVAGKGAGEKIYRQFNQIALEAGASANKLADAWLTMANAGVKLSEDSMRSIAAVGSVLGEEVYGTISDQLMLIAQRGELNIRQLDMFARAGIDARAILEDAFGMPVDKLKEKGIDAKQIIDALTKGMGDQFKDAANNVDKSWGGVMASLSAKWHDFKLTIADSGLFDMFKAGLKSINDLMGKVFDTNGPHNWGLIIANVAEKGVPILYKGITGVATAIMAVVRGFNYLKFAWQNVQYAMAETDLKETTKAFDAQIKKVNELKKAREDAAAAGNTAKVAELQAAYAKENAVLQTLNKTLNAQTQELTTLNAEMEEQEALLDDLRKTQEAYGEEAKEIGKALKANLEQINYLSNITEKEVLRLQSEADAAHAKAGALFEQITTLTAKGMQAGADLLNQYVAALHKANMATIMHMQGLDAYMAKAGADTEGLGSENAVKAIRAAGAGSGADTAKQMALAQAKAQTEMIKLLSEAAIKDLNNLLEDGLISLKDYYEKRRIELKTQYNAELALLDEQLRLTGDRVERFNLEQEKTRLNISFNMADADLQREAMQREAALVQEKAALLRDIEMRALEDTLENQMALRLQSLALQHEAEIEALRQKQATEEEIIQASLNHQLEMEKVKAQESRRIFESQMASYQTVANSISTIFQSMYEASGESNKAFLAIAKAAAIAEAIMNTQVAVTKALAEGGPFMGPALAAVAAASGAAAIATIMAQGFATGGIVSGHSSHKRADNIPARLTAGEFVHQVDAVDYYGTDVMQALNHRRIPKSVLRGLMAGINIPGPVVRGPRLAYGGVAAAGQDAAGGQKSQLELTIVNVTSEEAMGEYLTGSAGQMRIVNIIGQNKETVKQQLELT